MGAQLMRKIKKVMDLLQVNWRTMAEFEILYKVLSLTILALLLLTVCMAVYSMVDIGAVIFLLDQSYQGKKQTWCRR